MKIFKFQVDETFAKKHNELLRDSGRLRMSGIMLGLILIAGGVAAYLLINSDWHLTIGLGLTAFGILTIIIGLMAAKKVGDAQHLYDSYPLAPAVIAEVTDRELMLLALVNTNVDPDLSPRWGLALRRVNQIPGVKRVVGTKVPVAAVCGHHTSSDDGHWQQISPMPIAWGTPDEEVVNIARKSIPQEQWQRLERSRKRLNDVKATKYDLLVL